MRAAPALVRHDRELPNVFLGFYEPGKGDIETTIHVVRVGVSRCIGRHSSRREDHSHQQYHTASVHHRSSPFGVVSRALKFNEHGGFVTDNPRIVAGRDPVDISRLYFPAGPILVLDMQLARHDIADVFDLAAIGLHHWFDAFRPTPPGLKGVATDLPTCKVHELDSRFVRAASLVW
jgi:hypothetical protein